MTQEELESAIKLWLWLPTGIAIFGTILNARKNILCFPVWIVSNIALVIMNLMIDVKSIAALFFVYTLISIYGWIIWSKKDKLPSEVKEENSDFSKIETTEVPEGAELGKVKWYNKKKGFGFIIAESDEREVFFHQSNIDMPGFRIVQENQTVSFKVAEGKRGEEGREIKPV